MAKIMLVCGTRPEWIKSVSFIRELKKTEHKLIIVNSGQHLQLTDDVLKVFNIIPDYNLKIMTTNQSLGRISKLIFDKLDPIIIKTTPDVIVVVGDTTTALISSLCAFYHKIKIFHIEGGARSFDKYNAYPEEMNRRMIDKIADLNTCQTNKDMFNLTEEKIFNGCITGNNSLDVLKDMIEKVEKKKQILITMHRRENWGYNIGRFCWVINSLAHKFADHNFIISCHPNPIIRKDVNFILGNISNVQILDAQPYDKFLKLLTESKLVMTDSGGLPIEAMFLGIPLIIFRRYEYDEYLDKKYFSCEVNPDKIIGKATWILTQDTRLIPKILFFGDGTAGKKCVKLLNEMINNEK
jgi:UDP-N-acetylglucosamine 2-epimerase (non-hydrolysing)